MWLSRGMNVTTAFGAIEVLGLAGILFVGCAKSPRGADDAGVLRGTVSYRERVALPPDAVVVVRLSDVSRQDVASPVIAETRVASEGKHGATLSIHSKGMEKPLRFARVKP